MLGILLHKQKKYKTLKILLAVSTFLLLSGGILFIIFNA